MTYHHAAALLLCALGWIFGCDGADRTAAPAATLHAVEAGTATCDSSLHETSTLNQAYTFDLGCAQDYFAAAGCDFGLDPDGNGSVISSSTLEDMFNDPVSCQRGASCTGCTDGDSLSTVDTCDDFASFAYFTGNGWSDMQAACPAGDAPVEEEEADTGCQIEGLEFSAEEMDCALQFFTTMTCDSCRDVLDSRVCEDAINDAAVCQAGASCTGCDDGDARDNGVSCPEIAAYSYFGPTAAGRLLTHVQTNPCDGECTPVCQGRACGDDGCGGVCGTCAEGETCDVDGQCSGDGCTIEGVFFAGADMECALYFFETMTCESCNQVFDSRTCEDAINDAAACQAGGICTGCTDDDTRGDGVSCDEIAAYSYFGGSAAQALYTFVQGDLSCGEPDIVVDGVALTPDEAAAILDCANGASQAQLDDDAGLDSRAAANIVAARPFATVQELGDVSYVGATVINALKTYSATWLPPDQAAIGVSITILASEAENNGAASDYYDRMVTQSRVIITSDPYTTWSGAMIFYVADPSVGNVEQLKVYISADAGVDTSSFSVFDDVAMTGVFTSYGDTFEILVSDPDYHGVTLNRNGLAYDDYLNVLAAWSDTADHPEGAVYVESSFEYWYMVPLQIFCDHPCFEGNDPGAPNDDGNEQDHTWNGTVGAALWAWLQAQ